MAFECLAGFLIQQIVMKQILIFFFILGFTPGGPISAQQLKLRKGVIIDSLRVNDTLPESFALYLPTQFEKAGKWPVIFVFDMKGRGRQVLRMFREAAEKQQYILAASNNTYDSLSLSQNILIANRVFTIVSAILPVHRDRIYTSGFASGAKIAALVPTIVKQIDGVISCGSAVPNTDILSTKNSYHFVGIVGKQDFNYAEMLDAEEVLNKAKIPNNLLTFDGGQQWPESDYLERGMEILTLASMAKGNAEKDEDFIQKALARDMKEIEGLVEVKKMLDAYDMLEQVITIYRPHRNVDSLLELKKELRKDKLFRSQRRTNNAILFKESFIKEDYKFNLLEDISTLNYNNLGWWNYQMGELADYDKKPNPAERQMGKRLKGYLNALIEDNIDIEYAEPTVNTEALSFLWMLKTITDPKNYTYYLNIISDSAFYEDFGTALFYLEELLKNGYKDKSQLYELEHTALLRITPEFNEIVDKYLKDARYDLIEE